jgi:hypothetical protein
VGAAVAVAVAVAVEGGLTRPASKVAGLGAWPAPLFLPLSSVETPRRGFRIQPLVVGGASSVPCGGGASSVLCGGGAVEPVLRPEFWALPE